MTCLKNPTTFNLLQWEKVRESSNFKKLQPSRLTFVYYWAFKINALLGVGYQKKLIKCETAFSILLQKYAVNAQFLHWSFVLKHFLTEDGTLSSSFVVAMRLYLARPERFLTTIPPSESGSTGSGSGGRPETPAS